MSGWKVAGKDSGCEMSGWNVGGGRIPDVGHPGGMSENFRPGGMSDAMCGGLRMMKINRNRSGVIDGDVGMLDKTMNNK